MRSRMCIKSGKGAGFFRVANLKALVFMFKPSLKCLVSPMSLFALCCFCVKIVFYKE